MKGDEFDGEGGTGYFGQRTLTGYLLYVQLLHKPKFATYEPVLPYLAACPPP